MGLTPPRRLKRSPDARHKNAALTPQGRACRVVRIVRSGGVAAGISAHMRRQRFVSALIAARSLFIAPDALKCAHGDAALSPKAYAAGWIEVQGRTNLSQTDAGRIERLIAPVCARRAACIGIGLNEFAGHGVAGFALPRA